MYDRVDGQMKRDMGRRMHTMRKIMNRVNRVDWRGWNQESGGSSMNIDSETSQVRIQNRILQMGIVCVGVNVKSGDIYLQAFAQEISS